MKKNQKKRGLIAGFTGETITLCEKSAKKTQKLSSKKWSYGSFEKR